MGMKTVAAVSICVLTLSQAFAGDGQNQTVELKTGERVQGVFHQATAAGVLMTVAGKPVTIPLTEVAAIYLAAPPSASAYDHALDALSALQSVTSSGVTYMDYAKRVLDARIKVDKYMSSMPADRETFGAAMRYYELAAQLWNDQ